MTKEEFLKTFPDLVRNYQPSPEVLKKIGNVDLLMTIGPSGVGKTTLMQRLGIPFVPSDTTRPKRAREVEGVDCNFRSDYDQIIDDIKNGQFVQINIYNSGEFYSTKESSYPDYGSAAMAVAVSVVPVFRKLGFNKTTSTFITPPDYKEWMRRLNAIEKDQLPKRLSEAAQSLDFALKDDQMHFILNDNLDSAAQQVKNLLNGIVDEQRAQTARQSAQKLLDELTDDNIGKLQ